MFRVTSLVVIFTAIIAMSSLTCGTVLDFNPRPVPQQRQRHSLAIGYSHNPDGAKIHRALQSGVVNVLCWSFIHLDDAADDSSSNNQQARIRTDLNLDAIRQIRQDRHYAHIVHMAAVGGWNAPHPTPGITSQEWATAFHRFNQQEGFIFDGIDWDYEGHDDRSAATSRFSLETLNIMADMSRILKEQYGYLISMAPAESYLDPLAGSDDSFSLQLNLFPEHWNEPERHVVQQANFAHAGRQCYAYVVHRAGVDTFDWISIQLYESFSRFVYETTVVTRGQDDLAVVQLDALERRAAAFAKGFQVKLPVPYGRVQVTIPSTKLVWGFANGWADGVKVSRVDPQLLNLLFASGAVQTRGVMFWTIEEEGNQGMYFVDWIQKALERSGDRETGNLNIQQDKHVEEL